MRCEFVGIKSCVLRSVLEKALNRSRDVATVFTNTKFVVYVAIVLGTACAAQGAAQHRTDLQTGSVVQRQVPTGASGNDSFAPAPGQSTPTAAISSILTRRHSKHSHIVRRYRWVRRPQSGYCRGSSDSPFSAQHQTYRCKLFHRPALHRCKSMLSKFRKFAGSRAR